MWTPIPAKATAAPQGVRARCAACLALALWALTAGGAARAQDADGLPRLPEIPARPAQGPNSVEAFVEGLNRSDAAIEVKLGHGKILTLKQDLFAGNRDQPAIAVGDPGVLDFVPISARQIRLVGTRLGSTDLAITTANGQTVAFEVRVMPDLDLLRGQLRETFPDAEIKLGQVGDHLVVEGQARDSSQVAQILKALRTSVSTTATAGSGSGAAPAAPGPMAGAGNAAMAMQMPEPPGDVGDDVGIKILNLLRVPGSQQVLLKVRVAELNRTAFRQIGADILGFDPKNGSIFGTQLNNSGVASGAVGNIDSFSTPQPAGTARRLTGAAVLNTIESTTAFGIFQKGNFEVLLNALRRNSVLKILAEPNLMALNGRKASFLAGGEFPIPVPQVGATGVASTITVNFKKFGVQLDFLPEILEDDVIRLTVDPEVSSIDFTIGTTLVAGGSPVPGLNTRQAHTTVELKPGQTLAIAGLMQLTLDGQTARIPGLGDLPVLGPFFSNTTSNRVEKELVVMVTPYLVDALDSNEIPPLPGDEVGAPNDLEFYFLGRIEGRTGKDFRSTTDGADPLRIGRHLRLERKYVRGPVGFSN